MLSKGSVAFRGCGHLEARTACRSETHMPLVLILGQTPRQGHNDPRVKRSWDTRCPKGETIQRAVQILLLSVFLWGAGLSPAMASRTSIPIDVPGSSGTGARGINDTGQIVGVFFDASNTQHGFLLSGGSFTTIDVPGSSFTAAAGINDTGQIVLEFSSMPAIHSMGFC